MLELYWLPRWGCGRSGTKVSIQSGNRQTARPLPQIKFVSNKSVNWYYDCFTILYTEHLFNEALSFTVSNMLYDRITHYLLNPRVDSNLPHWQRRGSTPTHTLWYDHYNTTTPGFLWLPFNMGSWTDYTDTLPSWRLQWVIWYGSDGTTCNPPWLEQ